MIQTSIRENFLELFLKLIDNFELVNGNKLNVFSLKIQNNSFAYNDLIELLGNNLYHFALSRTEIKNLIDNEQYNTLITRTKSKFIQYSTNEGELGEILLYCLLESHLKAPKILTKLELKTSNNDYVKGSDGVHILKIDDKNYQLILGESKLDSNLQNGIYEAFGSLSKLLKEDNKKLDFEFDLINSQLIKESYDENLYKILKEILIPSTRQNSTFLDYSFGIFLGFDAKITDTEKKLSNHDFRIHINERLKNEIISLIDSINFQINKSEFEGYQFYIYIIPFSDLAEQRKKIIKELTT